MIPKLISAPIWVWVVIIIGVFDLAFILGCAWANKDRDLDDWEREEREQLGLQSYAKGVLDTMRGKSKVIATEKEYRLFTKDGYKVISRRNSNGNRDR